MGAAGGGIIIRRTCVISVFVVVLFVALVAPGLAYAPILPVPVDAGARLVAGTGEATWMWSESGGATLKAAREPLSAGSAQGPYTVVSGIASPGSWFASGDGLFVTVLWKDGDTVYVKRYDLSTGAEVYARKAVCTDAQAAALHAGATTVTPAGITADGSGGAYIWCSVAPAPTGGYTLLNHVDTDGKLATTSPVMKAVTRNVVALQSDADGHACVLLAGSTVVRVDRLGPDLTGDWANGARSPYLLPPSPSPAMTAIDLVATDQVFVIWREGGKVKAQRFALNGDRVWLNPPGVTMAGAARLAPDGSGGAYIVGPSGDGVVARHIRFTGREASWSPDTLGGLGLTTPQVDAVTSDRAGDLFVTYSDATGASAATSGAALMTYLGTWSDSRRASTARRGTRAPCPTASAAPTSSAAAPTPSCGASRAPATS